MKLFKLICFITIAIISLSAVLASAPIDGLLLHYTFDEGSGDIAKDSSGNGHDGKINQCLYVKGKNGFALDFGGVGQKSWVDCGSINVNGELTMSAWVYAYAWSDKSWSGIIYKSDNTYGFRNNLEKPGSIHFKITGDTETNLISNTILESAKWYHLAVVYKPSEYMRLYINGILDQEIKSETRSQINLGGALEEVTTGIPSKINNDNIPLTIGASGSNYFVGRIDDVRIYTKSLTTQDIKNIYEVEGGESADSALWKKTDAKIAKSIKYVNGFIRIYDNGGITISSDGKIYRLSSSFSAPVKKTNYLAVISDKTLQESIWKPVIKTISKTSISITSKGDYYSITRLIKVTDGKISIEDTYNNISDADTGIILWHKWITPNALDKWYLFGVEQASSAHDPRTPAINPTCYIGEGKGSIGVVVEDDILRNQLEARVSAPTGEIALGSRHFGLPKGKSYSTKMSIYTDFKDYFGFINNLRKEWNVNNRTIQGPMAFIRTDTWDSTWYREKMKPNPTQFRKFLDRKNIKVYLFCPWYRYWDGFDYTEAEFEKLAKDFIKTIKAVEPDSIVLASFETYYYNVPRSILKDTVKQNWEEWSKYPAEFALDSNATAMLNETPWKDSLWRAPDGGAIVSRSDPGPDSNYKTPPLCMLVYPELDPTTKIGNHFYNVRQSEIDYMIEKLGFDGVYMDMFGYGGGLYSYEKWDGHTVDINGDGEIVMKYSDLAIVTAAARESWLKSVIKKGKIALVNYGQPNTKGLQSVPYWSFVEARDTGKVDLYAPIPDASGCAGTQLSTPIGLGSSKDDANTTAGLYGHVKGLLRYGNVYHHYYANSLIPEEGADGGEYGPINHMFPITPVEIHKGWVKGKERIVSCVSFATNWTAKTKPNILIFDNNGRQISSDGKYKLTQTKNGLTIKVSIKDWSEFAIVE